MKKIIELEIKDHCLYVTDEDGTVWWFEGAIYAQMDEGGLKELKEKQSINLH